MAALRRAAQRPRLGLIICVSTTSLLMLLSQALRDRRQEETHKRDILDSTEIPAEHIDPAAIDLTPLVNTLINTSQSGSRQLFSLLSVTSYSSLALHKLTLLVYNISSIRSFESNVFRRRFCYCVSNETNDLTDFTAVLLDVTGNSTSHLHELFKSASILSVSQRNNSACIYICVMAGKMGREVPELWEVDSITPLFNQTIVEGPHRGNLSSIRLPVDWHQPPTTVSPISASVLSSAVAGRVVATAQVSPAAVEEAAATTARQPAAAGRETNATEEPSASLQVAPEAPAPTTPSPTRLPAASSPVIGPTRLPIAARQPGTTSRHTTSTVHPPRLPPDRPTAGPTAAARTTTPSKSEETEKPGCPWRRPGPADVWASGAATTVGAHKLQPCVLELCKFFSQCLCGPFGRKTRPKRYCDDSRVWYEKHTSEVCRRVRRVSFSRSKWTPEEDLKQRCLRKMCENL